MLVQTADVQSASRSGSTSGTRSGSRTMRRRTAPTTPGPLAARLRPHWYLRVKRGAEVTLAVLMAVVALPLIGICALLVKLTSKGPAFYSQVRLGLHGTPFRIYKIRTMVLDSERNGACWSLPGDPRVTRLGHFLRKTHLDELPQLWNVLIGDMSLVGPRPERPEFVPHLEQAIPCYRERLLVRPGLTGLAQVQLPPDTDLDSVRRKLAFDLYYVEHLSWWLDLKLLLTTSFYLINVSTGLPCRLFRIPCGAPVLEAYNRLATLVKPALPLIQPA